VNNELTNSTKIGTPRIIIIMLPQYMYMQLHFYVVIQSSGQYKSSPCQCWYT